MKHVKASGLRFGPLGSHCVHICVDMQRLFAEDTDWHTPWMPRVLPKVESIVAAHPAQTVFTRFVTLDDPAQGRGTWKRYYERWRSMTTEAIGVAMLNLVEPLDHYVPPAQVIDKTVYSPWLSPALDQQLSQRRSDTIIVTGGETDVCVLGTVLGAVDRGFRTIIVTDALCSSSDETHAALMTLYKRRYGQQVETVETDALLAAWI